MDCSGRVFVVTGAAAGIGRAVALDLLGRGARVAAVDLNSEGLQRTVELAQAGNRLSTHTLNIVDREAVGVLPAQVTQAHGAVDGLINVAGIIQPFVHIEDLDYEVIERVMDVNFWGTVHMVKAFLPGLKARPEASLVNVVSMGALLPVPGQSAYGASKAAVRLLTEGLYAELQGTAVAVSEVFPGAVGTEISRNSGAGFSGSGGDTSKTTSAQEAGRIIVDAVEKRSFRVMIGNDARLFDLLSRMAPRRGIEMIAKKMKDLVVSRPAKASA
ncbi:SDR family NAD(P)-dependent oxidoreductase [Nesterenkonia lutea]|uniref:NAD(P)-dependent dehydrogenase (Short-subunit alcohol dehydrogenase family) n=1 Tax=Nesterenkonia lutea TaxID=272919 RepID=A0ABR9JIB3_9MICC|nr:SDR family oxidoreductase [Nesterenkonia lutea]MBE1525252.1 NAD(P)-dependent dehydrogenase (short-subunit alcohol dehydrogenase family) [Nesterenkonia lutea]